MFAKLNRKTVMIAAATAIVILLGLFVKETYFAASNSYSTVGGKENSCQCTKRIDR